jgi:rsbT co-antagonist protein RsbR
VTQTATSERPTALPARLTETEARLAERRALLDVVFEHNPDGVCIAGPDGSIRVNPAGAAIMGAVQVDEGTNRWAEQYGLFREDQKTPYPTEELPLVRALVTRTSVVGVPVFMRNASRREGAWLSIDAHPLPGGGAMAIFRDVTRQRAVRHGLEAKETALAAAERENKELIERLRVALDELSTPVLELWKDTLVLPVIGVVDTQRSAQMTERLLAEVASRRARFVVVDLTGVEILDTATADRFASLARAVRMLGARCIVTGIQPAVAQTMVAMGVDLGGVETFRNLAHALDRTMAAGAEPTARRRERPRPS